MWLQVNSILIVVTSMFAWWWAQYNILIIVVLERIEISEGKWPLLPADEHSGSGCGLQGQDACAPDAKLRFPSCVNSDRLLYLFALEFPHRKYRDKDSAKIVSLNWERRLRLM